jgi:hypothetical protein
MTLLALKTIKETCQCTSSFRAFAGKKLIEKGGSVLSLGLGRLWDAFVNFQRGNQIRMQYIYKINRFYI